MALSFATLALLASAIIGVESPDGSYARNYAFPITGNGSLVLGVDPEGDQMQTLPLPRMHAPEIVWEGRRYARAVNRAALLSMGHWNTRISVDGVAVVTEGAGDLNGVAVRKGDRLVFADERELKLTGKAEVVVCA